MSDRWQYRLVNAGAFRTRERLVAALGELGSQGWELAVSIDKASNWWSFEKAMVIFQRRVPEGTEPDRPWASEWPEPSAEEVVIQ